MCILKTKETRFAQLNIQLQDNALIQIDYYKEYVTAERPKEKIYIRNKGNSAILPIELPAGK